MVLAYHQEKGDHVEILCRDYYFERVDPDKVVTYRAPYGAYYPDFMVEGDDGHPRKPTTTDMNAIFAGNDIFFRAKPSSNESRRLARSMELDAEQCRKMDAKSPLRVAITLFCDENCHSLSDDAMLPVIRRAVAEPDIAALNPTGWVPHPTTVREWMRERGEHGRRKPRDGVSMAGRYARSIVSRHPVELMLYPMMSACLANDTGQVQSFYDRYVADLWKVNNGKPLDRPMLVEGGDGVWSVSNDVAEYPKPTEPYKPVSYTTFWRRVGDHRTPILFGFATTLRGQRARYGGGGFSERPAFGSLCEADETPVPNVFLVDEDTGIGMGSATMTLMAECSTTALVGWDLCAEAASSASLLRTVRHANSIKEVPKDLLEKFPDLPYVRLRPDRIKVDNSSGAHSRHFEDACADAYIQVNFTGKEHPTHKALIERTIGTILQLLFKKLPSHNYDIATMRKFGFNPDKQVLCTISQARELLDRACFTYNISRHEGL
ncbi:hypothetical protein A9995_10520 [Erythrobacter sp. QSSC1-22B]|uniref:DDE-type integrase/transposase/recombinase n=1 Tax=Erythrobacter sp. QSSC1-22B TaxID=1860125 RepID=UPI000805A2B9|nr:DDE-type integrase/transposase/recombinase [Erythrobacter sp. QSSC1-22B]OBX18960.1 hypothetical protein A9995_10520 [Erythrobacter sp. QSSC1-22B]